MKWRTRLPDPALVVIALIGLSALVLTSVASYEFFGYVLPAQELALASTVVMAAGLPALKLAARFAPTKQQAQRFALALYGLLAVELVAQYFKAQAHFARQVAARPELAGSDLAAAAGNDYASRVLAFVFLASLPFVVVLCVDALADRWLALRSRRVAGLRARFARLRRLFARKRRERRSALRPLRAGLAAARAEGAQLRAERDDARGLAVQLRAELDRERGRPVLSLESAADLLIEAGAPEATIRTWRTAGRLRLAEPVEREG